MFKKLNLFINTNNEISNNNNKYNLPLWTFGIKTSNNLFNSDLLAFSWCLN